MSRQGPVRCRGCFKLLSVLLADHSLIDDCKHTMCLVFFLSKVDGETPNPLGSSLGSNTLTLYCFSSYTLSELFFIVVYHKDSPFSLLSILHRFCTVQFT